MKRISRGSDGVLTEQWHKCLIKNEFEEIQVGSSSPSWLQVRTHTHFIDLCRCIHICRLYSLMPQVFSICTSNPLSNNLLIVRKHLIRTIVPHLPFFPPHFKSLSPLPAHPPLFRFVGNCRCKHVDKWSFESPVTNDIYSATKRLFEWPPWACFTPTLVISCLMAKHLRLSAHPWRRFHEGPYLEIQLRWAFQEALLSQPFC